MKKTNKTNKHLRADSLYELHPSSDEENSLLPNEESLADREENQAGAADASENETGEYPGEVLEFVAPNMQPPSEAVEDSGDSANITAEDSDRLQGPIWAPRPEARVAALLASLDSAQLEIERQAQKNRELNTRMREIGSLVRQPDVGAAHCDDENVNIRARLDGGDDYLQALKAQTGKLETLLDSLAQPHIWVAEPDSTLDEDLDSCDEMTSKMQMHDDQLAQLEALVDQVCGADPSSTEIRQNAVKAEPAHVEYLETLTRVDTKDREQLTEVHLKDGEQLREVHADDRLLIATKGDHVIECPLDKSVITIGRGHFNDIQIRTRCVSRSHARIVTNDSDAIIEDMNSKNGITVNGDSVQLRLLTNGDVVEVGKMRFKFIDLMADDRRARSVDDGAADMGDETAWKTRDRRDRRNRRKETQNDLGNDQESRQRRSQDMEKRPTRDAQPAKKPRWKIWE